MNELQDKLVTCISMFLHIHQNESTNIILFDKGILINSLSYISKEFISENKKDLILFFKKYKIKLTIDKQIKIENNMTLKAFNIILSEWNKYKPICITKKMLK